MIEWATLQIVILRILSTRIDFECIQVQEHDALSLADISCIGLFNMRSNCIPMHGCVRWWTDRLSIKVSILLHEGHIHGMWRLQMWMLGVILLLQSSHLWWVAHVKWLIHFLLMYVRRSIVVHHLVVLILSKCLHVELRIRLLLLIWEMRIHLGILLVNWMVRMHSLRRPRIRRLLLLVLLARGELLEILILWRQIESSYLRVIC